MFFQSIIWSVQEPDNAAKFLHNIIFRYLTWIKKSENREWMSFWLQGLLQGLEIKIYKKRWLMLILFVLYSASNAMQWIQYSIIANIVMRYYNVSSFLIDMTSMIYMITYIPLIFPASYLLDKFVSNHLLTIK